MAAKKAPNFLEVRDMSLEEWLDVVFNPPKNTMFCYWCFPTDKHREEYLLDIANRSEAEVRRLLLSFLIPTGSLGNDERLFLWLQNTDESTAKKLLEIQFFRRLFLYFLNPKKAVPPWEGITWILDLLPRDPKSALEALRAYNFAHLQSLTDGRIWGLGDAAEIIQAKYIGMPGTLTEKIQFLYNLSPREFEHIIERLYSAMGYETLLTPPSKDGGRDIVAKKHNLAQREYLLIECKRYDKPVDIKIIRALLGVVSSEKVNKGVIATTSHFTKTAQIFAAENPRLELIPGDGIVRLMNEYLGSNWALHTHRLIVDSQRKFADKL